MLYLVGAEVLSNAAGLALGDFGLSNSVQQAGFTMVDVPHDGYHRRPDLGCGAYFPLWPGSWWGVLLWRQLCVDIQLTDDNLGRIKINFLIDGRHNAVFKELPD